MKININGMCEIKNKGIKVDYNVLEVLFKTIGETTVPIQDGYIEVYSGGVTVHKNGESKHVIRSTISYYSKKHQLHNLNGPAVLKYYENFFLQEERYYINSILTRTNGPAIIEYYPNGKKKYERWFVDNKLHRENGPAEISYDKTGKEIMRAYAINNIIISEEDFLNR